MFAFSNIKDNFKRKLSNSTPSDCLELNYFNKVTQDLQIKIDEIDNLRTQIKKIIKTQQNNILDF